MVPLCEHAGYLVVTFLQFVPDGCLLWACRLFLAPIFEVHEIRQAGPREMVIKWSWTMNFWWLRFLPFKLVWDPRLSFTGITILGYSESGAALQASNASKACCTYRDFLHALDAHADTLQICCRGHKTLWHAHCTCLA